jgi:hypothetical protein
MARPTRDRARHVLLSTLFLWSACDPTRTERSHCNAPQPILDAGTPSGFVRCRDGAINRTAAPGVAPIVHGESCRGDEENLLCSGEEDCTTAVSGNRCVHLDPYLLEPTDDIAPSSCRCRHACASDDECGAGFACVSPVHTGFENATCVTADCRTNADCASDECGLFVWETGCGPAARLTCRTAADTCRTYKTCGGDSCHPGEGWDAPDGVATCLAFSCAI